MADKVKLDHDWLEQAIESSGRHFMEVKPCSLCDGTGKAVFDDECGDCHGKGWVIK